MAPIKDWEALTGQIAGSQLKSRLQKGEVNEFYSAKLDIEN